MLPHAPVKTFFLLQDQFLGICLPDQDLIPIVVGKYDIRNHILFQSLGITEIFIRHHDSDAIVICAAIFYDREVIRRCLYFVFLTVIVCGSIPDP